MILLQENISLKPFNTLGFDVPAACFTEWTDENRLPELLALLKIRNKVLFLGAGSNIVLTRPFDGLAVKIATEGIQTENLPDGKTAVSAAAGENWHHFVRTTLDKGLSGLENLCGIPGTVGASPVQNIGAYGAEVAQRIRRVFCVDTASGREMVLSNADCAFAYRDSIFKRQKNWLITRVEFALERVFTPQTEYAGVAARAAQKAAGKPLSAQHVADAVWDIRREKLPDPAVLGNCGSFFRNPVLARAQAEKILRAYPHAPHYPQSDGTVKLAAGWLIDQCGLKGARCGQMAVYAKQALILVNLGNAVPQDLLDLCGMIQDEVMKKFHLNLVPEPDFIE